MLCLTNSHFAQIHLTIKGVVTDDLNHAIVGANILVQKNDTTALITFTETDDNGNFTLSLEASLPLLLKITAMGYQTKSVHLTQAVDTPLSITLQSEPFLLKESVISANSRIIEKSDTVTFNAAAFRDSTDRNLEQLLKKLPGVEVDKSGIVRVQGKPIKKILIEGDDLTGKNYQLLSQNIAADVIDKIQIIDKFEENKLLKGIRKTDDKVINITIKEGKKSLIFGRAELGVGTDKRTHNSLNLFTVTRKVKALNFANFNTVGLESGADKVIDMDLLDDVLDSEKYGLVKQNQQNMIEGINLPQSIFRNEDTRFNQSSLLSSNFLFRLGKNNLTKGRIAYMRDNLNMYATNNEYYQIAKDSVFEINERSQFQRLPKVFECNFDITNDINPKTTLQSILTFKQMTIRSNSLTNTNQGEFRNELANSNLSFNGIINLVHRVNDTKAWVASGTLSHHKQYESFTTLQDSSRILPFQPISLYLLNQTANNNILLGKLNFQFIFNKNNNNIHFDIGAIYRREGLATILQNENDNINEHWRQNNTTYTQQNIFTNIALKKQLNKINITGDVSVGFLKVALTTYPSVTTTDVVKNIPYCVGSLSINYKLNERNKISAHYSYNINVPQIKDINTGLILTDYRNFQRGSAIYIPSQTQYLLTNYTYGKYEDKLLAYLNVIAMQVNNGYQSTFSLYPNFSILEWQPNDFSKKMLMIKANLKRHFDKAQSSAFIKPSFAYEIYQNSLNNVNQRLNEKYQYSVEFSTRTMFSQYFTFHIGSTLTNTTIYAHQDIASVRTHNQTLGSFVDVYLTISPKLNIQLSQEYFRLWQPQQAAQNYQFIKGNIFYRIKQQLTCNIALHNILNTTHFINNMATDYVIATNTIKILPRYILGTIMFSF